jgi:hypothetical protein
MDRRTFLKHAGTGVSAIAASGLVSKPSLAKQILHGRAVGRFSTPAKIRDLHGVEQSLFDDLWHTNLRAFTQQAICGDPWAKTGMAHVLGYYDPTSTLNSGETQLAMVSWVAFPNRLNQYFGTPTTLPANPHNLSQKYVWALADDGLYSDEAGQRHSFPEIPKTICPEADWKGPLHPFGPLRSARLAG